MFYHAREVPAEWQRELEAIVPKTDRVPWLKIVWQPGTPYEPVQRWEIYEMVPLLQYVPFEIVDCLKNGQSPREWGEWVPDRKIPEEFGGKRWITSSLVSLVQWQLYHETGCYSQRFWIIQGERGGHKWKLSQAEQNYLAAFFGEGADTPFPGDRPYAEWDNRVAAKIVEHDKLRRWKLTTPWDGRQADKTKAGLYVKRDRKTEEERFAWAMLRYLESQVSDVVSDIPRTLLPGPSDLPDGDHHFNKDEDAVDRDLVENTATRLNED